MKINAILDIIIEKITNKRALFIGIFLIFAISFILPLLKYYNLNTNFYDFGNFEQHIFMNSQQNYWYWFIKCHFSPILFVYSWFYEIFSSAYTILILQFVAVSFSAFMVYKIAEKLFDKRISLLIVFLYMVHPMYLYQIFWDFHPDHIFLPLIITIFYIFEFDIYKKKEKYIFTILITLVLLSIKENFIISTLFLSIYILIKKEYLLGLFVFVLSIVTYLFASKYIGYDSYKYAYIYIESFQYGEKTLFPWFYHKWGNSYAELIFNILSNPIDALKYIFTDKTKIIFMTILFIPMLFVSVLVPRFLIVTIPGLAMILLATQHEKATIFHHYHASVFPILFIASIFGLAKLKNNLKNIYLLIFTILTIFYSWAYAPMPWGRYFYWTDINKYGYDKYIPTKRVEKIKELLDDEAIKDPNVEISFQNNRYYDILGHRKHITLFPNISKNTKFVVVDTKINKDVGSVINNKIFNKKIEHLKNNWKIYKSYDGFYIFTK